MSNDNSNTPLTPKSALELLKDWKELVSLIALTLISVFGAIGRVFDNHPQFKIASWILVALFVAIGAFVVHRKQKRKREQARREKIWADSEAQLKAGSAFRSLAPFEERDKLPGRDRKVEARAIATRIASDDFRFGVVCGDTGCGKTSMLRSEVTRVLRESGFEVAYVRNPRRLESKASEALPPTERLASELRALSRNYFKPTTGVVILDQFEEWFLEYQEAAHRAQIGRFIRKLAERSPRVRIVCAIRREFLIDFHDLSDELPQLLSTANLFHIKNFTVDLAKDVINECATADGLTTGESFAETVANDLADGGQVRPPELQIICTYLASNGDLSTTKYRQSGGTAGILANYIQQALEASRHPAIAARLLRGLCDFPAHAKQRPKTIDELSAEVSTDGSDLKDIVTELVQHFVLGRILSEEQRRNEGTTVGLMHDYLVEAVQLATSDASTKTEEANQLLRYYVGEQQGRIPFGKLRFIREFAERRYLAEPAARRLLRRSIIAPVVSLGVIVIAAISLSAGLSLLITAKIQWGGPALLGRHFRKDQSGSVKVERTPGKAKIVTGRHSAFYDIGSTTDEIPGSDAGRIVNIWDPSTGRILATVPNPQDLDMAIGPSGKFLLVGPTLLNLSTAAETLLSNEESNSIYANAEGKRSVSFSVKEKWLTWGVWWKTRDSNVRQYEFVFYPLNGGQHASHITGLTSSHAGAPHYAFGNSEDQVVVYESGPQRTVSLYDIVSEHRVATLRVDANSQTVYVDIHKESSLICTTELLASGVVMIRLWNLRDGEFIRESHVAMQEKDNPEQNTDAIGGAYFSRDGSHLIMARRRPGKSDQILVLRTADLEAPANIEFAQLRSAVHGSETILFWEEKGGTQVWDVTNSGPRTFPGIHVGENSYLMVDDNKVRAVMRDVITGTVELLDFAKGRKIAELSHSGHLESVSFTVDDTAVIVKEEGGVFSLFDSADGEPLVQRFPSNGASEIFYDRDCRRFNLWNNSGQVVRYTEGRKYFWRFVPSKSCM